MANVLGVSNSDYRSHDNAACLVVDGKLVAAVEEERLTRNKHAYDQLPINATRFCLEQAGLKLGDIDLVAVGWDLPNLQLKNSIYPTPSVEDLPSVLFPPEVFGDATPPNVVCVPHHLAHISSAFYPSGFDSAAGIVIDGSGETEATTLWHIEGTQFNKLTSFDQDPNSLGFMFEAACQYIGLPSDAAGIVMGLSSYGLAEAEPFDLLTLTDDGYRISMPREVSERVNRLYRDRTDYYLMERIRDTWIAFFETQFGPREQIPNSPNPTVDIRRFIAARVQKTIEAALLHSARRVRAMTGESRLCLSGGAALNCSANGVLEQSGIFDEVYLYPAANDSGVAVGAALYANDHLMNGSFDHQSAHANPYLGPEFSDAEILSAINEAGLQYERIDDPSFKEVANLLSQDAVIGWFQQRTEIGPRALGARSIIASPRNPQVRDKVNDIKRRERWRPLTPSVLEGYEDDFFTPAPFSPFMLKACFARPDVAHLIPGVVHVDNTCRYQSVRRSLNPSYWNIINSFREMAGIPMVMNTSFNDRGEPVVCTPQDAIRTFLNRPLDFLVIGNFIIKHP